MARPVVDYEAAWDELQELLLTRDGWGTRTILAEMAALRVKHKSEDPASAEQGTTPTASRAGHDDTEVPREERDERHNADPGLRAV